SARRPPRPAVRVLSRADSSFPPARSYATSAHTVHALGGHWPARGVLVAIILSSHDALSQTQPQAESWVDRFHFEGFVDGYASANYGFAKPQTPTPDVGGGNTFRAYDVNNGFALHW